MDKPEEAGSHEDHEKRTVPLRNLYLSCWRVYSAIPRGWKGLRDSPDTVEVGTLIILKNEGQMGGWVISKDLLEQRSSYRLLGSSHPSSLTLGKHPCL